MGMGRRSRGTLVRARVPPQQPHRGTDWDGDLARWECGSMCPTDPPGRVSPRPRLLWSGPQKSPITIIYINVYTTITYTNIYTTIIYTNIIYTTIIHTNITVSHSVPTTD